MSESETIHPLRPTLLVIASTEEYEGRALAERTARLYERNLQRLTQKFSQRHWDISACAIDDEALLKTAWQSFENGNMAIITGYKGTKEQDKLLSEIILAAKPLITLVSLDDGLKNYDQRLFHRAVSLLPQGLDDQFMTTNYALKKTREKNTWGTWKGRKDRNILPAKTQQKRLH